MNTGSSFFDVRLAGTPFGNGHRFADSLSHFARARRAFGNVAMFEDFDIDYKYLFAWSRRAFANPLNLTITPQRIEFLFA